MKDYHPDKHHRHSFTADKSATSDELEHKASIVTRAYDTLKDPHTRAVHLLEVLGKPLSEVASGELVGSEFLMHIMEIRESIQYCRDDRLLKSLLKGNQMRVDQTCDELSRAFESHNYDKALEETARLQYWHRIDETIREKINNID